MSGRAGGAAESGPVPGPLGEWFASRDRSPLGEGILLRWQSKSQGRTLANNGRAELAADGRLWVLWHPGGGVDAAFTEPLPAEPSLVLDAAEAAELHDALLAEGFADHDPWQATDAEDGDVVSVRARTPDDDEHEVLYVVVGSPFLDRFRRLVSAVDA